MPPKQPTRIPKYRLHKPSGLAVVRLNSRDIYLGQYNSTESRQKYGRLISEWLANNKLPIPEGEPADASNDLTINELVLGYLDFANQYYVNNGEPTGEVQNLKDALKPLVELYGRSQVTNFGPRALKTVRQAMIKADLSRKVINDRINRVRRIFKWGVENQLLMPHLLEGLRAVAPLRPGRTAARETKPIEPVPEDLIGPVLDVASRQIAAMIKLQLLTGMRPGEVTIMRTSDIDMTGSVWIYMPISHKTQHFGRNRVIYLGPQAQEVLKAFVLSKLNGYLFSPQDVVAEYRQRIRDEAQYPRPERKLKRGNKKNKRAPREKYTTKTYARAIEKACDRAFPPPHELQDKDLTAEQNKLLNQWRKQHRWSPNRLRHNAATRLRKEFGIEAARVILGHSSESTTEIYAEIDNKKAADIMSKIG